MMQGNHFPGEADQRVRPESFRLLLDVQKSELKIGLSESEEPMKEGEARHFLIKRTAVPYLSGDSRLSGKEPPCFVHLIVHTLFLADHRQSQGTREVSEIVEITDKTLEELAMGLLLFSEKDYLPGTQAIHFAVAMLCERLKSLQQQTEAPRFKRLEEWQICKIDGFLSGSLEPGVSVSDIARLCGLSVCHFSRLFKVNYGGTFHKFLLMERVARAMRRLRTSEDSLSEIALDCGFTDQSCFTRRFSMATGIPPGLWRKQVKRDAVLAADALLTHTFQKSLSA